MLLAWGEQAGSGEEHPAGLVEGVCPPAAPMVDFCWMRLRTHREHHRRGVRRGRGP